MQIDLKGDRPIYEEIYEYFKDAILEGRFKKGERLPSKRALAKEMSVATNTVRAAYDALSCEGYIESVEKRGYFVSEIGSLYNIKAEPINAARPEKESYKYSFAITEGDKESYPIDKFKKIFTQEVIYDEEFYERDYQGLFGLRHEIKNYLFKARGIKTSEDNIIISSGLEQLLTIVFIILDKKLRLGLENPGYKELKTLLKLNNIDYEPISLDNSGMSFERFKRANLTAALLTPSNQFPTATVMPIKRRFEFLNWAYGASGRYIIEDDYDSGFRYSSRALSPLKSLDEMDKVIYIANFSKSISPLLRLSYMVLPNELLKRYYEVKPQINSTVSNIVQILVKDFMKGGHFERQLNRMRGIYNKKRLVLLDELEDIPGVHAIDSMAGMHLKVYVSGVDDYEDIVKALQMNGIKASRLKDYYLKEEAMAKDALLLGYGAMAEDEIRSAMSIVKKIILDMKK